MTLNNIKTQIQSIYKKSISLGIEEDTPLLDQHRIQLVNMIIVFVCIMEIPLMTQDAFKGEWLAAGIGLVLILINCLPLYFNFSKRPDIATWIFSLYTPSSLAALIIIFGKEIANEYSFLIFTIHLIIFFRTTIERIIFSTYTIIAIGLTYYYTSNFESPLAREFNFFEKNALFIVVVAFIIFILKIYTDLTDKSLNKVSTLLEEQKGVNKELQEKKTTIERQNNELLFANEELEKFAYIASHDLKSPLRNVNSFLTLIERKIKQGRTDIQEDIQYATRASKQMYHLIEDILRFSRMKQQEMAFQKVATHNLVMQVVMNLEDVIKEKSGEVEVELLPEIECNQSQISLLFQNLIENAIKYNDNPKPTIEISSQEIGKQVLISVRDNGIGIPMDYQDKVFEMFARLHNQQIYEGTGLGLAICKRIVLAHQGDIWFKSDGENGTTFYIQLPISQS
ncbi:MAG: sensor histidine kinase [Saprospiraceae bacterium]